METLKVKLQDIATRFTYGAMPKPNEICEKGFPIFSGYRIVGFSSKANIHERTLIVVARGVGGTGDVKITPPKCYLTNLSIAVEVDKQKANLDYLCAYMNLQGLRYLDTGAAQSQITINNLKKHILFLPPLASQQKIASILSAYDSLIENNQKRIKLLDQMAENLYKEWFVRFRFPGYETAEFEGGVPKGWKIEKLGNVANICTGKCNREDAEEDGIYPLFDRSQEIKKSNSWIMDCEAIIVPGEGTSFIPRYYDGKFNLHQRCYCVEPKHKGTGKFLFYMLMFNRAYFLSVATGATVPSLRQNNFTNMKFVMPPLGVCSLYDKHISLLFNEISSLSKQVEILTIQRDLLLPRLMSGKLEVNALKGQHYKTQRQRLGEMENKNKTNNNALKGQHYKTQWQRLGEWEEKQNK